MAQNAPPSYSETQIYDLVDYYQLGANTYQQYLSKHLAESESIKAQNLETRLQNLSATLIAAESQIRKTMEEKQLNMMEFTKNFILKTQQMNKKNLTVLVEKIDDINNDLVKMTLDQFGVLSNTTITGYKKISYALQSNLTDLQQSMSLLFYNMSQGNVEQNATIISKINALARSNKESLNELALHQTEAFGSVKTKLESIMGQSATLAKVLETTTVMIEGHTSLLRAEIAKITAEIDMWKTEISKLKMQEETIRRIKLRIITLAGREAALTIGMRTINYVLHNVMPSLVGDLYATEDRKAINAEANAMLEATRELQ